MLVAAFILIFTACKKKTVAGNCYACTQYDSMVTPYYKIVPSGVVDTMCDRSQGWVDFWLKTHVYVDSFYYRTDSFAHGYTEWRCPQF